MSITLSPEEERFKDAYVRSRGYWVEFNDGLLRHNPRWLRAHLAYADIIQKEGPLDERMRELIFIAVDASTTHLYTRGLEIHIRKAFAANCSAADLIEVLLIAAVQGLDSVVAGVSILAEEAGSGFEGEGDVASALLDRYASLFGDRPEWLSHVAFIAPGYARALVELAEIAEADAGLTPRERTLVRLALAASPTHLNREAMRTETRRALNAGASPAELLEVFQLVGLLGMHACVDGIPAVIAAAGKG